MAARTSQAAHGLAVALLLTSTVWCKTPGLNIRTKNGFRIEGQRKQQMLQLAHLCDLSKYTVTREMVIGQLFSYCGLHAGMVGHGRFRGSEASAARN
jgi:hypothetical protein